MRDSIISDIRSHAADGSSSDFSGFISIENCGTNNLDGVRIKGVR
jgi:hypothetical protein